MLDSSIFRSYDIRGIVGKSITNESVFLIGKALGSWLKELNESYLIIARDGRLSSPELSRYLADGIQSSGCDVIDIGMVPTPLLYYATHVLGVTSGVMLTGSHNPGNYNGLKMVVQGKTLSDIEIGALYQRITEKRFSEGNGSYTEKHIQANYIADVERNVYLERPLSIVVDAGNGVAGQIAPVLFKTLGCEVHTLFCDIDGNFPNHHPDPSQDENLQDLIQAVIEKGADIGLAFDGDGDRIGIITNKGNIVAADRLLMLFAKNVLAMHKNSKIIFDVKCTNNLPTMIAELGGEPVMCKTGHSFIKAKMVETNAQLGGEVSGHLFFKDRWFGFDDALYAGARMLEILASAEEDCDALFADIPTSVITPELRIQVDENEKFSIMRQLIDKANFHDANDINTIDGLRVSFQEGWGLVRPSNTTPYLILRFEALNESVMKRIQDSFRHWMLSVMPEMVLPF